jgi:protocadherin Fat 1/2/3
MCITLTSNNFPLNHKELQVNYIIFCRETIEEHILTVMVKDQGTPSKRNYARVVVTVHDHNDHPPEFTSPIVQGKVFETSPIGTAVVQVYAIDRDRGQNAKISYSITSGKLYS